MSKLVPGEMNGEGGLKLVFTHDWVEGVKA